MSTSGFRSRQIVRGFGAWLKTRPIAINPRKEALATTYVHGPCGGIFATHPSVEQRIAHLQPVMV